MDWNECQYQLHAAFFFLISCRQYYCHVTIWISNVEVTLVPFNVIHGFRCPLVSYMMAYPGLCWPQASLKPISEVEGTHRANSFSPGMGVVILMMAGRGNLQFNVSSKVQWDKHMSFSRSFLLAELKALVCELENPHTSDRVLNPGPTE